MKKYLSLPLEEKIALLLEVLREHKALHIVDLNIAERSSWADSLLIASAGSVRHAQSLADEIRALCARRNLELLSVEGYQSGQWILVDLNDVVVNIFQTPVRELYRLESLWAGPPSALPQEPAA